MKIVFVFLLLSHTILAQNLDSINRSIHLKSFDFQSNTKYGSAALDGIELTAAELRNLQQPSAKELLHLLNGVFVADACQSCGFSRLQTDGLNGPYTGLLLNGRPFLPSLAMVYGLEFLPSELLSSLSLDRSGLAQQEWAGNFPAGLIQLQTDMPALQTAVFSVRQSLWEGGAGDRQITLYQPLVGKKTQASIWLSRRDRTAWDVHPDGFSESPKLQLNTFGFQVIQALNSNHTLECNVRGLVDARSGGSDMHLPTVERRIAETIDHQWVSADLVWNHTVRPHFSQSTFLLMNGLNRQSYYGGNGLEVAGPDTTGQALKYAGDSHQFWLLGGWKSELKLNARLQLNFNASLGRDVLRDATPGFQRKLQQLAWNGSAGIQLRWKPKPILELVAGIQGLANFFQGRLGLDSLSWTSNTLFPALLPAIGLEWKPGEPWQMGVSYRMTQRAPQIFEEDIHLSMLGAQPIFVVWQSDLKPERGHQTLVWARWKRKIGKGLHTELQLRCTVQRLSGIFIWENTSAEELYFLKEKTNGSGLWMVSPSMNFELSGTQWKLQAQGTANVQSLDEPQSLWDESEWGILGWHDRLLQVPHWSGLVRAEWFPGSQNRWSVAGYMRFWGPMDVLRMPNHAHEWPTVVVSPELLELALTARKQWLLAERFSVEGELSVHNLTNALQTDYGQGIHRDPNYVYGPGAPRRIGLGIRCRWW
jgi:outer membrane receptor for ferrienterochelin and colicins